MTEQQEDKAVSELFVVLLLLATGFVVWSLTVMIESIYRFIKGIKDEVSSL